LSYFEHQSRKRVEAEDSEIPDKELIELVLRLLYIGLEYIPKHAIRVQKYYIRQPVGLCMCLNTSLRKFVKSLIELICYLLYFFEENLKHLDQDEMIEILDQAKATDPEWHEAKVNVKIDIFEISHEESASYLERLENLEKIRCTNGPNPSSIPIDNRKRDCVTSSEGKSSKNHKGSNMLCPYYDKDNHNMADCRAIAKFKQQ
jgi:hypothetical protein